MGRLDTWHPIESGLSDPEIDSAVDTLGPASLDVQRRMDDRVNTKRYAEGENKDKQGVCNFCGHATKREFCGGKCETKAAFASMGKSLKFFE